MPQPNHLIKNTPAFWYPLLYVVGVFGLISFVLLLGGRDQYPCVLCIKKAQYYTGLFFEKAVLLFILPIPGDRMRFPEVV